MTKLSAAQKSDLFNQYAHALFCAESDLNGPSPSLEILSRLSGKSPDESVSDDRRKKVAEMLTGLDETYTQKVLLLEDAAQGYYQINRDCDDDQLIKNSIEKLEKVLSHLKADSKENIKTRNQILNRMYDFDEQISPKSSERRFSLLEKMVRDIKQNNGEYDHDPLNSTARRIDYFMKDIPAKKRLSLLLQIKKKTIDHNRYDYTNLNTRLQAEYKKEMAQQAEDERLQKIDRYDQIRTEALPAALKPEEKISLYTELMGLIDVQDWSRGRKFAEKKTICNHLINLNTEIGNEEARKAAFTMRQKYINAGYNCQEAAKRKGYYNRN